MATLRYKLHGVEYPNPFGLGSGPPTTNGRVIKGAHQRFKWAFADLKTMSLDGTVIENVKGRLARPKLMAPGLPYAWLVNRELTSDRKKFEYWTRDMKMLRNDCPELVISASVIESYDKDRWIEIIQRCDEAGAHTFTLNLSCPHGFKKRKMGSAVGEFPDMIGEVCGWACGATKKPVYAKLYPNVSPSAYNAQAEAAFKAGCLGVTCTNTFRGLPPVNLRTLRTVNAINGLAMTGGTSGAGILPLSLAKVYDVAVWKNENGYADRQISGVGGIYTLQDAVSHLCYGASSVQICTAFMTAGYGPGMLPQMLDDMLKLLEEHKMDSPADLFGCAVPSIVEHDVLIAQPGARAETDDEHWDDTKFTDQVDAISV